jgi:uncharacterized phage protein (TIGR01671 family)
MLEIKFRAWDKRTKKMYEVVAIDWVDGKIITAHLKRQGEVRKVYPEEKYGDDIIFMQYTGLPDTNGVEICKDDIVEYKYSTKVFNSKVQFKHGMFCVQDKSYSPQLSIEESYKFEIIGNKWDYWRMN